MKLQTRQIVLAGLMGALLMVLKEALAPVPGVEPVSLLVILYALCLPAAAPWAIAVFVVLEFILYGFGLWSWMLFIHLVYPVRHCPPFAPYGQRPWLGVGQRGIRAGVRRAVHPRYTLSPRGRAVRWRGGLPVSPLILGTAWATFLPCYCFTARCAAF